MQFIISEWPYLCITLFVSIVLIKKSDYPVFLIMVAVMSLYSDTGLKLAAVGSIVASLMLIMDTFVGNKKYLKVPSALNGVSANKLTFRREMVDGVERWWIAEKQ